MSHQDTEAVLKHGFKPRLNTLFVPKCCSMCGSACHTQGRAQPKLHAHAGGTPKLRNPLILLRLMDVFQEQWNSIACLATCSSFSTILPPSTLGRGITQLHSQKERLPQAPAAEGSLSRACTTALKKKANHSIS